MKLKFKKQQYQEDAIQSVVKCFEGQPKGNRVSVLEKRSMIIGEGTQWEQTIQEDFIVCGNKSIELTEREIRNNIRKVQKQNNLDYTDNQGINDFSIEMETGTGKTYTYIKTMYELNKEYGWSKFIVMVPSIAIREGVLKSFQITEDHFQELYNKKIRYFVYDSKRSSNIANISNFAEDYDIQVMIINYQAFNSEEKVKGEANRRIYKSLDELQSRRPIDVINSVNPIIILDEPQKIADRTEQKLKAFSPLFTLRYSATHKKNKKYNMIYRLDAVDAYNKKLVKKINVKGIEIIHNRPEGAYLYLEGVNISTKEPVARMEIEIKLKKDIKRELRNFKVGDDLYKISGGIQGYKGYIISEIDASNENYDKVLFINGEEICTGQVFGDNNAKYMTRIQIRETIKEHFEKEREYCKQKIKVLSLFFIDEVAKYKVYDEQKEPHNGEYAEIFEEEYNKIFNDYYASSDSEYKKYLDSLKDKKVHAGYFSIDKKASKGKNEEKLVYIDSIPDNKKNDISSDEDAYDLIMKDKERLLSFEEPVRFVFSHSALREGWDNPNIFQICTLKKSNSEMSKRQEIGRGLRICVNADGDRMDFSILDDDFFNINNLTVVASESYQSFASAVQKDIAEGLTREVSTMLTPELLEGKHLKNELEKELVIDQSIYMQILVNCVTNKYIDEQGNITQKFKDELREDNIVVPIAMEEFRNEYILLMKRLFTPLTVPVENKNKNNIYSLIPNSNFKNEEFQKLWNILKAKTIYKVDFDSKELVERAVESLNNSLKVNRLRIKVTTGEQKEYITAEQLKRGDSMHETKTKTETFEESINLNTKYDLLGSVARETNLTRKTIAKILENIDEHIFEQYQYNPEEFIRRAAYLINIQKSLITIKNITYKKIDEYYDDKVFNLNNINGRLGQNAVKVKRNVYDYLITDSLTEKKFAMELENGEVEVYAKLPNNFKIPTPLGNYNPDWAIVLKIKDCKPVYFLAETKGDLDPLDLRPIEEAKISCVKKHLEAICNKEILCGVVSNYDEMIDIVLKNLSKS